MTNISIHNQVLMTFAAVYPMLMITVSGAGSEEITVKAQDGTGATVTWVCELSSDDDEFFHFFIPDTTIEFLVAYPEDMGEDE
jgi:hypothetical protein